MPESDVPLSQSPWHALTAEDVARRLGVDATVGLPSSLARERLESHGANELTDLGRARWQQIALRQFASVLIGVLVVASLLSFVIGETTDGVAILAIVMVNAALGFAQEWKAERALSELKRMLAPVCTALREGQHHRLPARDLVPGDIVVLASGDRVPADLRIVESVQLRADESSLTGESDSVGKAARAVPETTPMAERACMAWMGTTVTSGRAVGIVVATGMSSAFGRVAALTQQIDADETPLQRKLSELGRTLGYLSIAVTVLVVAVGLLVDKPLMEMVLLGISLAVAVVPEGLPAVVTITLALGVREMVRRRALPRRLQAVEALGAASVICTDKTGTLTQNQMTVVEIWLPAGTVRLHASAPLQEMEMDGHPLDPSMRGDLMLALVTAAECNRARLVERADGSLRRFGEPTESALLWAARSAGIQPEGDVVGEAPFDSSRKRMTVVVRHGSRLVAQVKGAPETIIDRSAAVRVGDATSLVNAELRDAALGAQQQMANRGLRTLALAQRELPEATALDDVASLEHDLTLLAIVGIVDPPRPDVPAAVEECRRAGIELVMITGDSAATAQAIARQIGMPPGNTVTGPEIDDMSDAELGAAVRGDAVFSRATPEHKLRLVDALIVQGKIVAMTGDGVNDAPALKKADIGVAMGVRGTDVAKGAADLVLTDDNFASIVAAVEEGRRQYDNVQKFVRYLLTTNWGELLLILSSVIVGGPLALLPVQLLWVNLVTDGISAIALGLEPVEAGAMRRLPRPPGQPLLNRGAVVQVLVLGTYEGLVALGLFYYFSAGGSGVEGSVELGRTATFTGLVVMELVNALNFRALRAPLHRIGWFTNPWLLAALLFNVVLQVLAVELPALQPFLGTQPLTVAQWAAIVALSVPLLLGSELHKIVTWSQPNRTLPVPGS